MTAFELRLTQRRILREALHTHRFAWDHVHNGSISRLQGFGVVLQLLSRTTVNLLLQLGKLAGNVSGVAVNDRRVACTNLPRVIQNDNLKEMGGKQTDRSFLHGVPKQSYMLKQLELDLCIGPSLRAPSVLKPGLVSAEERSCVTSSNYRRQPGLKAHS